MAALSLYESMLLALVDLQVIREKDFAAIVRDAAQVHQGPSWIRKNRRA
jgi:hypothetical protein